MIKALLLIATILSINSNAFCQIKVAVAANAQFAMKELAKNYEKETGNKVELIISSSGKLTTQIKEGAPFDIFLSADTDYPEILFKDGFGAEQPKIYAYGSIVLWTCKNYKFSNVEFLNKTDIKSLAIANPKIAPYGEAAIDVLKHYKIYDKISSKLVYGESISQVNQYINSQVADFGFTAKSVVLSPEMQGKGSWIEISPKAYKPIAQSAILLKTNNKLAKNFYTYLYSPKAQKVFKKYGYLFSK